MIVASLQQMLGGKIAAVKVVGVDQRSLYAVNAAIAKYHWHIELNKIAKMLVCNGFTVHNCRYNQQAVNMRI